MRCRKDWGPGYWSRSRPPAMERFSLIFSGHFNLLQPILRQSSCLKCAKWAQVEIAGVAGPEKVYSEFTKLFYPLISIKECRKMYKVAKPDSHEFVGADRIL